MDNEPEIECDGWVLYRPNGECLYETFSTRIDDCWYCHDEEIVDMKAEGYTARPVCFVSPDQKNIIAWAKKVMRTLYATAKFGAPIGHLDARKMIEEYPADTPS